MSVNRFIYWHKEKGERKGKIFATVHLLVGYNQGTIEDFKKMAAELRKTLPEVTDDTTKCGIITKSSYYQGHSIIEWSGDISPGEYPEFRQRDEFNPEYKW